MPKAASAATWAPFLRADKRSSASAKSSISNITSAEEVEIAHTARKWSGKVNTDSTHPPEGLFNKDPETIARALASKRVSPKGPGSGMRMLTFYINRAGHNLSATRRAKLDKAKELLSARVRRAHARAKKAEKRGE